MYAKAGEAETLVIRLTDSCSGMEALLYYGVLDEMDVITRAAKITNQGTEAITLKKAASMNLDWEYGDFEWISFYGRHSMEMNFQREGIHHGIQAIGSVRGTSSHQYNPFIILCEKGADETMGSCYGLSFVYSGNGIGKVSRNFHKTIREHIGQLILDFSRKDVQDYMIKRISEMPGGIPVTY